MNIMVFQGLLGSGKTMGASILAKYYQEQSGCTLYSNFGLKDATYFDNLEVFYDIARQDSSIFVMDEGHMDLDSRSFSSNHVKYFSQLAFYLRKLRCTMFITTPLFDNIDSRIRGITNILVDVTKTKTHYIYAMYDYQADRHLRTIRIKKEDAHRIASDIYDTTKMVVPVVMPEKKEEFNAFLDELKKIAEGE